MRTTALLLLISVLLVSCSKSPSGTSVNSDTLLSQSIQQDASYKDTLGKTSSKIKDTKEFEECMMPSVNMCISQVGNQLARSQKSAAFCDEMLDDEGKEACKFGVIMTQATDVKDIKLCDKLNPGYKLECRISLYLADALASGDSKKCDLIAKEDLSSSGAGGELSSRGDQCRSDVIIRKPDAKVSDCNVLKNGPSKEMCIAILRNRSEGFATLPLVPPSSAPSSEVVANETR